MAQDAAVTGKIEWGVWIDADGCQHWWADGGTEGYMVPRRDPEDRQAGLPEADQLPDRKHGHLSSRRPAPR